ncbi:MAG: hypothetical protein K2L19_01845 [Eubacterium sp.]|nr:hypothetical protein [Eubacterium sp.]
MKSILQSIQPQYCELIAAGKKTIEVRKTRPKLDAPFKVYIYCTRGGTVANGFGGASEALRHPLWRLRNDTVVNYLDVNTMDCFQCELLNGKVIGEYVCDEIIEWTEDMCPPVPLSTICLSYSEIRKYGGDKTLYLWHISDLKIYDKPKELSEFCKPCKCLDEYEGEVYCDCLNCEDAGDSDYGIIACDRTLKRPPQSWCYVEEV